MDIFLFERDELIFEDILISSPAVEEQAKRKCKERQWREPNRNELNKNLLERLNSVQHSAIESHSKSIWSRAIEEYFVSFFIKIPGVDDIFRDERAGFELAIGGDIEIDVRKRVRENNTDFYWVILMKTARPFSEILRIALIPTVKNGSVLMRRKLGERPSGIEAISLKINP